MKKIGIITYHNSNNYGAVLQAYALKTIITKLGAQCDIIDYKNPHIEQINKVRIFNFKSLKTCMNSLVTYPIKKQKANKFAKFREKYLKPSVICIDENLQDQYDTFITGSDQVWNCELSEFDTAYFLDFVIDNKKKNAYAASFGFSDIPEEYTEKYRSLLKDFNEISVREAQGAMIIQSLLERNVPVVLDPTLLLNINEWDNAFQITKNDRDPYILLYLMIPSKNILKFAEQLSQETGCEIIYITDKMKRKISASYVRTISPEEWVKLFINATYIITNSFHGTAFSINFNKPFFVEMLPPPAKVNSRLENILDTFDLRSRQIINGNNSNIFIDIDYKTVNKKLELERKRSLDYLKRILEK
ncbi:MAG: polysaccharide pyruvyl transferase family protein [Tissierellia bacterium]|nr:polysaccharide pyruvyl transferase family protein [Tissierellia bacterium]